jgi:hypothetical protein
LIRGAGAGAAGAIIVAVVVAGIVVGFETAAGVCADNQQGMAAAKINTEKRTVLTNMEIPQSRGGCKCTKSIAEVSACAPFAALLSSIGSVRFKLRPKSDFPSQQENYAARPLIELQNRDDTFTRLTACHCFVDGAAQFCNRQR